MIRTITVILIATALQLMPIHVQAGEINGRVTSSETGNPIGGATITVLETETSTPSDKYGAFSISDLSGGLYHIIVSHIAYDRSDTLAIAIPSDTPTQVKLAPTPWVLNDVVVTGTRSPHLLKNVPVQTEVVTSRDFKRTGSSTVDEALTSSIGISIDDDVSGKGATIRGIKGDRVLVLVDGERAVGRVRGSIDLGQFSLTNVEKIEVVKGTGSTLYGSDAMGGVVNIITHKPKWNAGVANVYMDYGSHNAYNPSATVEYGTDRLSFSLGGKYYSTDGFDLDDSSPHTKGEEETDRWNFDAKMRARLSGNWSITTSGRFMSEEKQWIEYDSIDAYNENAYDDIETNQRYEGSVAAQFLSGDKYSMNLRLYGTYYDHRWDKLNGAILVDRSDTQDKFYGLSYSSNYVVAQEHVITCGFDINRQDLTSPTIIESKKADDALSGYFQYEYSPFKSLNFLPGIRYENHSSFGGHVNPSINIMYSLGDQVKLRGSVGKGFRAPSIKQQYFVFDHQAAGYIVYGGNVELPDSLRPADFEDLRQETSINSSISAEFSYGTIGMHRVTYFYNHLDDLIEFEFIDFRGGYWRGRYFYQNVERAMTQGIEWESRVRLSKAVDFSFSYNYLHSRDLTRQRELIGRPSHTIKFNLMVFDEATGLGASFWGDHHSRKLYTPRENTGEQMGLTDIYAPERTRLNLNVFKRFSAGSEVFVRCQNVLDETDFEFGYWPGFEVFAGFRYEIPYGKKLN